MRRVKSFQRKHSHLREGIGGDDHSSWYQRKVRKRLGIYLRRQKVSKCKGHTGGRYVGTFCVQAQSSKEGREGFKLQAGSEEDLQEAQCQESRQEESMKSLIRWVTIAFALVGNAFPSLAQEQSIAPPERRDLVSLFDGESLSGWSGDERLWSVRDGVIRGETTDQSPASGNTFLIWKGGALKDFELRLSFRCNATNNSGIQYRSKHITDGSAKNPWVVRGYQHEIRNELQFPNVSGFIYDEGGKRGRLCLVGERAEWREDGKKVLETFLDESAFQKLFRLDEWNDVVIIAKGNRILHFLNGQRIVDFTDLDPTRALNEGVLALQLHAGKPMWVEYRNIRLRNFD